MRGLIDVRGHPVRMQQRMIDHRMGEDDVWGLLERAKVAAIATVNDDGTPYVTPVHFACLDGRIYFHGLGKGQKIGNMIARPSVSMTVWEMGSLIIEGETPCNVNTGYGSVVVSGKATIVGDMVEKDAALRALIRKYVPHMCDRRMPEASVRNTAVVRVDPESVTGKTHP